MSTASAEDSAKRWSPSLERARSIPEDRLAKEPLELLLQEILAAGGPQMINIEFERRYSRPHDGVIEIRYPCTGDVSRLNHSYSSNGDQHELSFNLTPAKGAEITGEDLAGSLHILEEALRKQQTTENTAISRDQVQFVETIRPILEQRWTTTRMLRGALAELSIPLSKVPGPSIVPVRPSPLSLTAITTAAEGGTAEWVLEERLADGVVETIAAFARSLERSPAAAARLVGGDEETLRDVLLCILNAGYQGTVTGETFIGDGKSDLLLRWKDRDAFVGECKMWKGASALSDGIEQLLSRYTLWRHTRVALVVFFDQPKVATALIAKAHQAVANHPRTRRVLDETEPSRRVDYEVDASGDNHRPARLTFLPVVLRKPVVDAVPRA